MKRLIPLMLVTIISIIVSCKKTVTSPITSRKVAYTCTSCMLVPDAMYINDNDSKGIYKGVLTGTTGTIKFDIFNTSNLATAVMVIDGEIVNLSSTVAWTAGTTYKAPFTGTLNGLAVSVTFCVNSTGVSPKVTAADIPGHPGAVFSVTKETSTALIEAYEGTYTNTSGYKGTFNIALSRSLDTFTGIMSVNGVAFYANLSGTIVNGNLIDTALGTIGTINGDKITGTFNDANNISTTFSCKRTL